MFNKKATREKHEVMRQQCDELFFKEKRKACFECQTPINSKTRKRILVIECTHAPESYLHLVGYQVCHPCAAKLLDRQMDTMQKISQDMAQSNLLMSSKPVGGIQ